MAKKKYPNQDGKKYDNNFSSPDTTSSLKDSAVGTTSYSSSNDSADSKIIASSSPRYNESDNEDIRGINEYKNIPEKEELTSSYSTDASIIPSNSADDTKKSAGYPTKQESRNSSKNFWGNVSRVIEEGATRLFGQSSPTGHSYEERTRTDYEYEKRIEEERKKTERKEREERERREKERLERERQEKEKQKRIEFEEKLFESSRQHHLSQDSNTSFSLFTEKKEGLGEDAMPLVYQSDNEYVVGVFDGMGGAGAAEYQTFTKGSKTGAYLSSRVVRALCYDWLEQYKSLYNLCGLKHEISKYLNYLTGFWNIQQTGLRSSLIRVLPTTLAIVEARKFSQYTEVYSYWAGDSRNYILYENGLIQISKDDLRHPQDPLENLRNDDALSNCICQDRPFVINKYECVKFYKPIIILSATDGCFGYLPTPMHFEFILLNSLMNSNSCEEWKNNIKMALESISSDDFTIGMQMIGKEFSYFKERLYKRFVYLLHDVIEPIDNLKKVHESAIQACKDTEQRLNDEITNYWNVYKIDFMSQI